MHVCNNRQVWKVVVVFNMWFRAFFVHNVFSHHHVFMTLCCFIVLHIYVYIYSNSSLYIRWRFLPYILQNRVWQVKLWDSLSSLELDNCLCISKMSGVLTKLPRQACAWHLDEGLLPLYDHPDIIYLIPTWCKQGIWTWEALFTKSHSTGLHQAKQWVFPAINIHVASPDQWSSGPWPFTPMWYHFCNIFSSLCGFGVERIDPLSPPTGGKSPPMEG